jgi:hypothetical protein
MVRLELKKHEMGRRGALDKITIRERNMGLNEGVKSRVIAFSDEVYIESGTGIRAGQGYYHPAKG